MRIGGQDLLQRLPDHRRVIYYKDLVLLFNEATLPPGARALTDSSLVPRLQTQRTAFPAQTKRPLLSGNEPAIPLPETLFRSSFPVHGSGYLADGQVHSVKVFRVAHKEITVGRQVATQSSEQLLLSRPVKIDNHVAAENDMDRSLDVSAVP